MKCRIFKAGFFYFFAIAFLGAAFFAGAAFLTAFFAVAIIFKI